jgi:TonB family protein
MMNPNPGQFGGSFQQTPQPQRKGCLGRNWKWMLPVGCLGLLLGVVALVVGIVFVTMSAIKSSEVYQGALKIAQTHPAVTGRLGEPVKDGWRVKGSVKFEGGSGRADFEVPLYGPEGEGSLHVVAVNEGGTWMYEKLDFDTASIPPGARPGDTVAGTTVSLLDRNVVQPPPGSEVDVEEDADGSNGSSDEAGEEASDATGDDDAQTGAVSAGALDGKAVSKPQPPYPALAKAARASGKVTVRVTVDETGSVVAADAVSGHPLLRAAASAAARQAKFSPTLEGGKPVRVTGTLTYNFVLEQ